MFIEEEEERLYEEIKIVADAGQGLMRIDKFLMLKLPNVSRSKLQEAIREGVVLVNGRTVSPNHRIHPKDEIIVMMPEKDHVTEVIPEDIPLHIVYEDDELLVINKEAGMVVHPGHGNWTGTLVNALAFHFKNLPTTRNGEMKPGLVHRIDKDTSGLLVIAKTEKAMTHLAKQFFDHTAERTYYALVWGLIDRDNGTIEGNIGRSLKDRRMSAVFPEGDHGKPAITHYKVIERLRYVTLVACKLETGRTHQIRAHMKHIGHTLFGDEMYGGTQILKGEKFSKYKAFVENCFKIMPRQALHAKTLGFVHPSTGQWMQFDSELPADFQEVLEKWRHYLKYH